MNSISASLNKTDCLARNGMIDYTGGYVVGISHPFILKKKI
jgi:hypothetical protein